MAASTKKRKKRQWKRFKRTIVKPVEPAKESKKKSTNQAFQQALDKVYGGTVTPLNAYLNERAVLLFHCDKCGMDFYNRPSHMLGKHSQRHVCTMPYGDRYGNRFAYVASRGGTVKKKNTGKKKHEVNVAERLTVLIEQDYTYSQIAKELGLNPALVKYHFQKEGLI